MTEICHMLFLMVAESTAINENDMSVFGKENGLLVHLEVEFAPLELARQNEVQK
jgi:hypothetical protein